MTAMKLVNLSNQDLNDPVLNYFAEKLRKEEQIFPFTEYNIFNACIYCILTPRENYPKLKIMQRKLKQQKLDNLDSILSCSDEHLRSIVPWDKADNIRKFCNWWRESDFFKNIIQDYADGMQKPVEIREQLIEAPGFKYKCASLLLEMAGYENVISVDLWVLRYLRDKGHSTLDPDLLDPKDTSRKRGPSKRQFLESESYFIKDAKENNVSPAHFRRLLWCKYSTYQQIHLQLDLFDEN
jgi:thermostable 8-oxoguanine DNA glycosylase